MPVSLKHTRGFSLIEVLVAVVVLAIGLLGLASLQANGMRFSHSAYLRSQATVLAYDIADRMRANMKAVDDGDYNNPTPAETATCLNTTGCSSTQMAKHDYKEWRDAVGAALPAGGAVVCIDSDLSDDNPTDTTLADPQCDGSGSLYAIKIWWADREGNPQLFLTSFQP